MTHGSLFSGIGGFDCAAKWMGWKNAFHCEIDEFCIRVLRYHFPNAEHYDDIRTTDFTKWRGRIDVLSGGFPCQPFSVAGRRKGADDDRYLWPEMLRAIREIQPSWVVGENVAGILTMVQPGSEAEVGGEATLFGESYTEIEMQQQYVVETVCQDLECEGYSVQPFVIPACAVGAPHRRDRIWFVAKRADTGTETVQREREYGVLSSGVTSDTHRDGRPEETQWRFQTSRKTNEQFESVFNTETASDPDFNRQWQRTCKPERIEECERPADDCPCRENGIASYSDGKLSERRMSERAERRHTKDKRTESPVCIPDWSRFPTQSPVRSRDDGFPIPMDGFTFPKWRTESIKAYGNAVVPQVVYEIFKAIESYERA